MARFAYHYTDKNGFNGIRSTHPDWKFAVCQPPPEHHPPGAYFTSLVPTDRQLAKKLRIPVYKTEYCFEFADVRDLKPIRGDRGQCVFYSPEEYCVTPVRQRYNGERADWKESAA
jgi:hypothetical protein